MAKTVIICYMIHTDVCEITEDHELPKTSKLDICFGDPLTSAIIMSAVQFGGMPIYLKDHLLLATPSSQIVIKCKICSQCKAWNANTSLRYHFQVVCDGKYQ